MYPVNAQILTAVLDRKTGVNQNSQISRWKTKPKTVMAAVK
jgi:hypothetical protein